jgi:hypothetical protein
MFYHRHADTAAAGFSPNMFGDIGQVSESGHRAMMPHRTTPSVLEQVLFQLGLWPMRQAKP